jgi:hypothetical protein
VAYHGSFKTLDKGVLELFGAVGIQRIVSRSHVGSGCYIQGIYIILLLLLL